MNHWVIFKDQKVFLSGEGTPPTGAIKTQGQATYGEAESWYEKGERIPDENLIKSGKRKDYRGEYWGKITQEKHIIDSLDVLPLSDWTSQKPLDYSQWNEKKNLWIVDQSLIQKHREETAKIELTGRIKRYESTLNNTVITNLASGDPIDEGIKKKIKKLNKIKTEYKIM